MIIRNQIQLWIIILLVGMAFTAYRVLRKHCRRLQLGKNATDNQNQQLRQLLNEKEWLVKEIHHRVKNNLQIAISLLNTQCEFIDNQPAIHAIQESRERLQAIAIIHQRLYQVGGHDSMIDMRSYIDEMIYNLRGSYATGADRFTIQKDIDHIELDLSQAVPIGLVLNEAITNCMKYAFSGEKTGTIEISLRRQQEGKVLLRIADDGPGLPASLRPEECKSFGLRLIQLFSQQLKGELRFINKPGLEITMLFQHRGRHSAFLHRRTAASPV
jgi:two-component sensor histidine kinase